MKKPDQLDQQFDNSFGRLPVNDPRRKAAKAILIWIRGADKVMADYVRLRCLSAAPIAK